MTDASNRIVQNLWSYCNVLRDDGFSYQDYLGRASKRAGGIIGPDPVDWSKARVALRLPAALLAELKALA